MKLDQETARKLTRDISISILIYALPVLLMLLTFHLTGQRPWKEKNITNLHNQR